MAEIGGVAVAAKGFDNADAAAAGFHEKSLRWTWESDDQRPRLKGGFVVREAAETEANSWREGRAVAIRGHRELDPGMNPELYFVPSEANGK